MLQEIKTLVQTLNEQRDAYYNKDSPKMTDVVDLINYQNTDLLACL